MTGIKDIQKWAEEALEEGVFLLDIIWKPGSTKILVLVDGDSGVTIENCRKISKHISFMLDEQPASETPYTLEVSSPGADMPLRLLRQYFKHIGRELSIRLHNESKVEGKLKAIENEVLEIQLPDKKGRFSPSSKYESVSFQDILESTIKISFK